MKEITDEERHAENQAHARLSEAAYELTGQQLWSMVVEVVGEDRVANMLAHTLASMDSWDIEAAAKRAGVKL